MKFQNVSIIGLAHVDAPHRITSSELENQLFPIIDRIHVRPNIIQSLTGIVARRFWEPGRQPSEAATMAAEKAIVDAGIPTGYSPEHLCLPGLYRALDGLPGARQSGTWPRMHEL